MGWIKDRLMERTSWDGGMLIAVGVVGLMMPLDLVSYAAIAWGVVTLLKSEQAYNTFHITRRFFASQDANVSTDRLMDQTFS